MPGLFYAEQIHDREDLDVRWEIEARYLAKEPFEEIAKKAGMDVEIIQWYEKAFFSVVEKIDNKTYITHVAMGRSIHRGLFERDYDLLWKMLGYACGPHMVDSLVTRLTNPQRVLSPDQVDATKHTLVQSATVDKALTAMLTLPVSYNQAVVMECYHKQLEIAKNAGGGGDVHNLIVNNVHAALTSLPFSTERPAVDGQQLKYYDDQSAELRADEMLAVGLGFDSPALRDAVNVNFPGAKDGDYAANQQGN